MVGIAHNQQLTNYVRSMREQGILDEHFVHLREMQEDGDDPQFVMNVISVFFNDSLTGIENITTLLNKPDPDYQRTIDFCHFIKGCSGSIGGRRMAMACTELKKGCAARDKSRCLELFERVKEEYTVLKDCLNDIYQLETAIFDSETRRRHP